MAKKTAADGHEYDVSSTANATVAPTNEHTLLKALPGANLGSDKLEFITVVQFEYSSSGKVDHEFIRKEYGYTEAEYEAFIKDVGVVQALVERGVDARHLITKTDASVKAKVTPIQLVAANALMDLTDTRSNRKKLQDLGVSSSVYQMWLRDPNFSGYLKSRAESLIGDNQHEALLALMDRVSAGDIKAISLYLELTGRFVPQSATAQNGMAAVGDIQQMIVRIIEIVIDEVDDQDTAVRIADRLKGLVVGNQVAGILPVGPSNIEQPEIAAPRVLTPEIQEIMSHGGGYND